MLKINIERIKNNSFAKGLTRFANSNFIASIIAGIMIWVIVLVPTWLYLIVRALTTPAGFWQEFALFATFAILIGWLQAILIIFGGVFTFIILLEGSL